MENGSYEDAFSNRQAIMASNYCYKPLLSESKVFTCKYCGRRFLNSRALGGHQNAHKKERTIWMLGMSNRKPLGMEPHDGLLNKTIQKDTTVTAIATATKKAIQSSKDLGEACTQQTLKEAAYLELDWPGRFNVFYSDSNGPDTEAVTASYGGERMLKAGGDALDLVLYQQPDQSCTHGLDLDLHL